MRPRAWLDTSSGLVRYVLESLYEGGSIRTSVCPLKNSDFSVDRFAHPGIFLEMVKEEERSRENFMR